MAKAIIFKQARSVPDRINRLEKLKERVRNSEHKAADQDWFIARQINEMSNLSADGWYYGWTYNDGGAAGNARHDGNNEECIRLIVEAIQRNGNVLTIGVPLKDKEKLTAVGLKAKSKPDKKACTPFTINFNDDEQYQKFAEFLFARRAEELTKSTIEEISEKYKGVQHELKDLQSEFSKELGIKIHAPFEKANQNLASALEGITIEPSRAK